MTLEVPDNYKYHKMIYDLSGHYGSKELAEGMNEVDYWIFRGLEAQKSAAGTWLNDQK